MECAGVQLPRAWQGAGKTWDFETVLLRTCRYSDVPGFTRLGFSLNYLEAVFLRAPYQMHESPFLQSPQVIKRMLLLSASLPALPQQLLNLFQARPDRELDGLKFLGMFGQKKQLSGRGKPNGHNKIHTEKCQRQSGITNLCFSWNAFYLLALGDENSCRYFGWRLCR